MADSSKALIVEGGAMRGIFASGVLDTFMASGYSPFDLAIGVSAGATNLTGYVARQPGRSRQAIMEYAVQKDFFSPVRFFRGGHMTDVSWLWHYAQKRLPLETLDGPMAFYATLTHVETGAAHYMRVSDLNVHDLMVATCAIPYLYRDQPLINGEYYVDGGVADSIPVRRAYEMGARDITVVLSRPLGYRKKPVNQSWLLEKAFGSHAHLLNAMLFRSDDYNASLDFIANPPPDCRVHVIAPPPEFAVSRLTMNQQRLADGYRMGVTEGERYLQLHAPVARVA
ncbi:patatin family protein [Thalassolituus sp.]|uniref:patatin-like phospholipase family protein n=1 Tax=Thalassolituus sp. TaxID=2030822 RepID=UPI003513E5AC